EPIGNAPACFERKGNHSPQRAVFAGQHRRHKIPARLVCLYNSSVAQDLYDRTRPRLKRPRKTRHRRLRAIGKNPIFVCLDGHRTAARIDNRSGKKAEEIGSYFLTRDKFPPKAARGACAMLEIF
ncbi:MAG: hypothetical protein O7A62_14955, partial [Alphaproteobacteria bacterium]|nr:hypothetical protein [Alphaproteobacteria bacterium]